MENNIRTGRISSVNFAKGMVRVVYADKGNAVSAEIPVLNLNGEYKMPRVNDMVLVVHLSNGTAMGIVLGTFWSTANKPKETGEGLYRKELDTNAYLRCRNNEITLKGSVINIEADTVRVKSKNGTQEL